MIDCRFVPIETWPGKPKLLPRRAIFRVKYSARLDLLEKELYYLGAREILVQAFFSRDEIRNDGWPRSSARPRKPGVIVSFTNKQREQFSFPCDTYDAWEDNLYAIALSLEALRTVDRYGVTQRAEQYQGWKQIESPAHQQQKDSEWAYGFLASLNGIDKNALRGNRAALDLAYRAAAKKTHPDSGGNTEAFQILQEARTILGL